jgi:hypothetical protein
VHPETRYARSGDVNITYTVTGTGPFDLVFVPGFVSNVELDWGDPLRAVFLRGWATGPGAGCSNSPTTLCAVTWHATGARR